MQGLGFLMVKKSSPGVNPKPPLSPFLDSTGYGGRACGRGGWVNPSG